MQLFFCLFVLNRSTHWPTASVSILLFISAPCTEECKKKELDCVHLPSRTRADPKQSHYFKMPDKVLQDCAFSNENELTALETTMKIKRG